MATSTTFMHPWAFAVALTSGAEGQIFILRTSKVVDNYLVTDNTLDELASPIREILQKCKQQNLTISKKKFTIDTNIKFAGFQLSQNGMLPYDARLMPFQNSCSIGHRQCEKLPQFS